MQSITFYNQTCQTGTKAVTQMIYYGQKKEITTKMLELVGV